MNPLEDAYRVLLAESVRPVPPPPVEYPEGPTRWLAEDQDAQEHRSRYQRRRAA